MKRVNPPQINPRMIVLGRESRGIAQEELAEMLFFPQGKMSKIENGMISISEGELKKISDTLRYPPHFFMQTEQIYGLGISELYHRQRKQIPMKVLRKVYATVSILIINMGKLLKSADLGEIEICQFDIDEFDSPEKIAQMVRAAWRLPLGPIENVISTIETAGGIVIPYDFETDKVDALSIWIPKYPPFFFINTNIPTDRLRFSLCHELGHVVMHKTPNDDMENQADRFAGEFLAPAREIRPSLDNLNFERLVALKQYWKISMASLIYNAKKLNEISENQARYLYMQLSRLGYKTSEPYNPPIERPRLFYELFQFHLSKLNYTLQQLAELLAVNEDELKSLFLMQDKHLKLIK